MGRTHESHEGDLDTRKNDRGRTEYTREQRLLCVISETSNGSPRTSKKRTTVPLSLHGPLNTEGSPGNSY